MSLMLYNPNKRKKIVETKKVKGNKLSIVGLFQSVIHKKLVKVETI